MSVYGRILALMLMAAPVGAFAGDCVETGCLGERLRHLCSLNFQRAFAWSIDRTVGFCEACGCVGPPYTFNFLII